LVQKPDEKAKQDGKNNAKKNGPLQHLPLPQAVRPSHARQQVIKTAMFLASKHFAWLMFLIRPPVGSFAATARPRTSSDLCCYIHQSGVLGKKNFAGMKKRGVGENGACG
jgi:hypothetical protein